jgi:hypothetical protein
MVATGALATNTALAETVNVPFSFTANGKTCPAGRYSVDRNDTIGVVMLRSEDGRRSFSWLASPGDPDPSDSRVILRFDEEGRNHTLQSVQYGALITSRLDGRSKQTESGPTRGVLGR